MKIKIFIFVNLFIFNLFAAGPFTDNIDGTVKDNVTGLVWQKCSMGQNNDSICSAEATRGNWQAGLIFCSNLTLASRIWRLPSINELKSLIEYSISYPPYINSTFFPATATSDGYWSSTTNPANSHGGWMVNFKEGTAINSFSKLDYQGYVRCVSGP